MGGNQQSMSGAANTVDLGASSGGYNPYGSKSVFTIKNDKKGSTGGTISEGTGELSGGSNTGQAGALGFGGWSQDWGAYGQDTSQGVPLKPRKKPKKGTISEGTGEL